MTRLSSIAGLPRRNPADQHRKLIEQMASSVDILPFERNRSRCEVINPADHALVSVSGASGFTPMRSLSSEPECG